MLFFLHEPWIRRSLTLQKKSRVRISQGKTMKAMLATFFLFFAGASGEARSMDAASAGPYKAIVSTSDQTPRMMFPSGIWSLGPLSVLGVISASEGLRRASEVRARFGINDPSGDIARALASDLEATLSLSSTYKASGLASDVAAAHFSLRSPKELQSEFGPEHLVVNVGTQSWSVNSFSRDKFRLMYMARAEIVDTNTGKLVAKAECVARMKRADEARRFSTMLDNDAEALKAEITEAVDNCLDAMRDKLAPFLAAASNNAS